VPLDALLAAFRVRVDEVAIAGFELKPAVTPLGNPLTLSETAPAYPPVRVMFTEKLVVPPRDTLWEAGLAVKLKSPAAGAVTISVTEVVRVRGPPAPVMVSKELPVGVVAAVVTVNVEEFAAAGFGLKAPVAPAGNPLTLKVTPPVNPPRREMFAV